MYGEGAIGGAINIIPKGPLPFARNEAEVSFDTNRTRRIAVDSGGRISKDVAYPFAATGKSPTRGAIVTTRPNGRVLHPYACSRPAMPPGACRPPRPTAN